MILLIIGSAIGLIRKQSTRYWQYLIAGIVAQSLFYIVGYSSNLASNDIGFLSKAIIVIGLGWALPIYLVAQGYKSPNRKVLTTKIEALL